MKNALKYLSVLTLLLVAFTALASCGGGGNTPSTTVNPTSIAVSASAENVLPGQSVILQKSTIPANANAAITWKITEGESLAGISGDVLVVKADAPVGATIKVQAVCGTIASNELSLTVGYPITSITASAIGSTSLNKGGTGALNAFVTPANATGYTWVITEGGSYATIAANSNMLVVNSDAPTGATIKVKAVCGAVESNEVVFTVLPSQDEIQDELDKNTYFISLSSDDFILDLKGTSAPMLSAEIYNLKGELITDKSLIMTVKKGAEFLSITQDGFNCYFKALGHGEATVEVRIDGTNITETADVKVIVPPDAVKLPEVFGERTKLNYAFSLVDPDTGAAESLPFVPTLLGKGACTDFVVSFMHESGASGDAVAVYENGAITFKMTGKVIVTVSSASGSKVEAKTAYTFDINEGYNVSDYTELQQLLNSSKYNGQQINFVVLEKPDGSATGYTYGYDIVSPTALKPHSEQTVYDILHNNNNRLIAVNKSLYINGNNHKINMSQLRIFTYAEYVAYCTETGTSVGIPHAHTILSAEPYSNLGPGKDSNVDGKVYSVNLYNLEVVGNCSIDYDRSLYAEGTSAGLVGAFARGINVNTYGYGVKYYIDANNLTASATDIGMGFLGVVGNGKVSNVYAYNCYSTGVAARSSIITLENLKFGPCGATGIELAAEECDQAGLNDNENQHVTIAGTFDASQNLNSGNTNYFNNYNVGGATIPQIIAGNVAQIHAAFGGSEGLGDLAVSHIQNEKGEFIFGALIFMNVHTMQPNTSTISYPAYMAGGIINVEDLPTDGSVDTTHQFVRMTVYVTLPGLGTVVAGSALFYNMHYGK